MSKSPRSLTAILHVKFNYDHTEEGAIEDKELEILNMILDKTANMDPQLQELMAKFANYLSKLGAGPD